MSVTDAGPGPETAAALAMARELLRTGQVAAARESFRALHRAHPDDLGVLWALADLQLQDGDLDAALQSLTAVADTFMRRGFLLKAVAARRRAQEICPDNVDNLVALAELLARDGQRPEAQRLYHRIATLLRERDRMDDALEALRRGAALGTAEGESGALVLFESCESFGVQMLRAGRLEAALAALEAAWSLKPDSRSALRFLLHTLLRLGWHDRAVGVLRPLLEDNPQDQELWTLLGRVHLQADSLFEAAAAFHQLLTLDPSRTPYMMDVAGRLRDQGQLPAALAALDACVPGLVHKAQEPLALAFLETLREREPRDPFIRMRVDALTAWMAARAAATRDEELKRPWAELREAFQPRAVLLGEGSARPPSGPSHPAVPTEGADDVQSLERLRAVYLAEGLHEKAAAVCVTLSAAYTARGDLAPAREAMDMANRLMAEASRPPRTQRESVDGATGIAGKAEFEDTMHREYRRATRDARPLSVVLLEPDQPATMREGTRTDQEGRLRKLAHELFAALKRAPDLVARVDELTFAVLLPETPTDGARVVADALRTRVGRLPLGTGGAATVTASAGAATVVPVRGGDPVVVMLAARQALRAARSQGGSCTVTQEAHAR